MSFDLKSLGNKLKKYREQLELTIDELSSDTGIPIQRLSDFEEGKREPTGDEILIFSDRFKCDYNFFISNEKLTPFEKTEILYRKFGDEFSKEDRWAIQEFLYLCECEEYLLKSLPQYKSKIKQFQFVKKGNYFKKHGWDSAAALRKFLGYKDIEVPRDIYTDFRNIGIHIFRRKLSNSNISGLYIKHPTAGKCVLVNYDEDVYRQRFTVAHEAGHAILDDSEDPVVSFKSSESYEEIRANNFASHFLIPPEFLKNLNNTNIKWDEETVIKWANELRVNIQALVFALENAKIISNSQSRKFRKLKIPNEWKIDPELPENLLTKERKKRKELLQKGLSTFYVKLCFEAYRGGLISIGRLVEMLLTSEYELASFVKLFGERLKYGD